MSTPNTTTPAKPEPTPHTDALYTECNNYNPLAALAMMTVNARILERHLRRIVEAWEQFDGTGETSSSLCAAIQTAKEEIK